VKRIEIVVPIFCHFTNGQMSPYQCKGKEKTDQSQPSIGQSSIAQEAINASRHTSLLVDMISTKEDVVIYPMRIE
jgi:hypothetical protein